MPRGRKLSEDEKKQRDANKLFERIMKKEKKLKNQIDKEAKSLQDKIAKQEARIIKQIEKEEFKIANKARMLENKRKKTIPTADKYLGLVEKGKSLKKRIVKAENTLRNKRLSATEKEINAIKAIDKLQKRIKNEQDKIAKLSRPKKLTKKQGRALQTLADTIALPADDDEFPIPFPPSRAPFRIARPGPRGGVPRPPSIRSVLANQAM